MRHSVFFSLCVSASACTGMIDMGDEPPDLPPTDVQVVVRDGQTPQAGVLVIFRDAAGVATEVRTDATGAAAAELPDGGSLTIVRPYPTEPGQEPIPTRVVTYVGVRAGDRLSLGRPVDDRGTANAILVKVPQGANGTVKIQTPCGGGQGTGPLVAITVRSCAPEIGLYVEDGDKQSFFKRAAFSENIDVSTESLVGGLVSEISATNVAPNTAVSVEQRLGSQGFDFYTTGAKRVEAAPATVTLPPLNGVEHLVIASISGNNRTQVVASRKLYTQDTTIVDASAGLIASVTGVAYKSGALTWTEEGAGVPAADAVLASLTVSRADQANPEKSYVRVVLAPHAGPSLQLPVLSGSAGAYNPVMGDQVSTALGLAKATGGYDALRPRALSVASLVDATPVDGQTTLSYTGTKPGL